MKRKLYLKALLWLLWALPALAQNPRSDGIVFARSGHPAPGAFVAVCSQPAITAASEVGSIVTIATTLNPPQGTLVTISGVTPAGYNGSFTVATSSPSQLTYNALITGLTPGTSFGTAVTSGPTPCAPLLPLCSSVSDTSCTAPNPVQADGLGNYSFYVQAGNCTVSAPCTVEFYGSGLTTIVHSDQSFGGGGGGGGGGSGNVNPNNGLVGALADYNCNAGCATVSPNPGITTDNLGDATFGGNVTATQYLGTGPWSLTTPFAGAALGPSGAGVSAFGVLANGTFGDSVNNGNVYQLMDTCNLNGTGGGTNANVTATLPCPVDITKPFIFSFFPSFTFGSLPASTLAVNGGTAFPFKKPAGPATGTDLTTSDLVTNVLAWVEWNPTLSLYQLLNPQTTTGGGGGGGSIGGGGSLNFIPLFTPDGVTLGNSPVRLSGGTVLNSTAGLSIAAPANTVAVAGQSSYATSQCLGSNNSLQPNVGCRAGSSLLGVPANTTGLHSAYLAEISEAGTLTAAPALTSGYFWSDLLVNGSPNFLVGAVGAASTDGATGTIANMGGLFGLADFGINPTTGQTATKGWGVAGQCRNDATTTVQPFCYALYGYSPVLGSAITNGGGLYLEDQSAGGGVAISTNGGAHLFGGNVTLGKGFGQLWQGATSGSCNVTINATGGTLNICGASGAVSINNLTITGICTGCGSSVRWDLLTNPVGNLALTMGSGTSIFSSTSAVSQFFAWKNTTAAVSGTPQFSPLAAWCGTDMHAGSSGEFCWTLQAAEQGNAGNDVPNYLNIAHTGSATGYQFVQLPNLNVIGGAGSAGQIYLNGAASLNLGAGNSGIVALAGPSQTNSSNYELQFTGSNTGTAGAMVVNNATGIDQTISYAYGPTTPNSVPFSLTSTASGGVAGVPLMSPPGLTGRAVTGTTATDTIVSADCSPNRVEYVGSVNVAITLPTATTLGITNCTFVLANLTSGAHTLTITPTTWTIGPNAAASFTVLDGQSVTIGIDPNSTTNWFADLRDIGGAIAGSNITITRTAGLGWTIAATGGAGSGTVNNCATTGGMAYYAASGTAVSCAAGLTENSSGVITTYDGTATAGIGSTTVYGVSDVTARSTSQTTTNIIASTAQAGHYRISYYLDQNAVCATPGPGQVILTFNWTDATHARSQATIPLAFTAAATTTGFLQGTIPLWSATASAISYTSAVTACTTGTATYDVHITAEETE